MALNPIPATTVEDALMASVSDLEFLQRLRHSEQRAMAIGVLLDVCSNLPHGMSRVVRNDSSTAFFLEQEELRYLDDADQAG